MTINFYLDSKIIDGNKKAIYCYIRGIENKKKTIIPTNIKINPEHWNKDKQEVRKSENLYSQMNNHLVKMKDKINQLYFEEIANNPVISKSEFDKIIKKELINKKEEIKQIEIIPSKPSLSQYYKEYLISKAPVLANNSMKNYTILKNHLLNYEKIFKVKLTFEDMNFEFFDKFRN